MNLTRCESFLLVYITANIPWSIMVKAVKSYVTRISNFVRFAKFCSKDAYSEDVFIFPCPFHFRTRKTNQTFNVWYDPKLVWQNYKLFNCINWRNMILLLHFHEINEKFLLNFNRFEWFWIQFEINLQAGSLMIKISRPQPNEPPKIPWDAT